MHDDDNAPGRSIPLLDRTFVKTQGCWNCKSFENGPLSRAHWEACRQRDMAHMLQNGLLPLTRLGDEERKGDEARPGDPNYTSGTMHDSMERWVKSGKVGICLAGKSDGDFVHHKYHCMFWSGRQGYSLATGGLAGKADKEIGELLEIAESRAKKPIGG